jgi:diketogulonate reductase-like aldo/keto reductase
MAQPTHQLNSGLPIPAIGLGTFLATTPGEVGAAVTAAVKAGYRLIDCAAGYGNQKEVGGAIAQLIADGVVTREELFVVSKLFQTHHVWEGDDSRCHETLAQTLEDLGLDYLDLFLVHWPFAFGEKVLEKPPGSPQPLRMPDGSPNPIWSIKMEYLSTWRTMEGMVAAGKCKSIGVSNFTIDQLGECRRSQMHAHTPSLQDTHYAHLNRTPPAAEHLREAATTPPAVNQIELHPYFQQAEMVAYCAAQGIKVMGYSPLGSAAGPNRWVLPPPPVRHAARIQCVSCREGRLYTRTPPCKMRRTYTACSLQGGSTFRLFL